MRKIIKALFCVLLLSSAAFAQHSHHGISEDKQTVSSKGELKAIDLENKKLTISHEPIEVLSWPAMIMRFTFEDEGLIKSLKVSDKIEFSFVQQGRVSLLKSVKRID